MRAIENTVIRLPFNLRLVADNTAVVAGTIRCAVMLDKPGDADHGKMWDADDDSWDSPVTTYPTATYVAGDAWRIDLLAALTTSKAPCRVILLAASDNLPTIGSETTYAGGFVVVDVYAEDPLETGDITTPPTANAIADQVWEEAIVDHSGTAGSTAEQLDAIPTAAVPTANAIADQVWEEAIADHSGTAGSTAEQLDAIPTAAVPTANAIADQVWEEAIADHSGTAGSTAEALAAVAEPSGVNTVTLTVEDASTDPISDVEINVYDSGNTSFIKSGRTNGSGILVTTLDDATYKLRLAARGYGFTTPTSLVVSGNTAATITATTEAAIVPTTAYEAKTLRRQKVKYNSANADAPIKHQLVLEGAKITPTSATITVYAPGNTTAVLAATAMSLSGTILSHSLDTTTTATFPIGEGYRAEIATTYNSTVYTDVIMFDIVKFILTLDIGFDQIVALDDGVRGMLHDGDSDFSELIMASRDVITVHLESRMVEDDRLNESMIIDSSQVATVAKFYILSRIWLNKGDMEKHTVYKEEYEGLLRTLLATLRYDQGQDGDEDPDPAIGGSVRLKM